MVQLEQFCGPSYFDPALNGSRGCCKKIHHPVELSGIGQIEFCSLANKKSFQSCFFWIICQRNHLSLCLGFRADKKYDGAIDQKK